MERNRRVEIGAGVAMLVLCLVIAAVEASSVRATATTGYLVGWTVVLVVFLVALTWSAVTSPTRPRRVRVPALVLTVLTAGGLALLSPSRGGLVLILVVLSTAVCALHVGARALTAVVVWNSAVVAATSSALGPLVDRPSPPTEVALVVVLYAMLQAGSAAMVWSQQRVAEALADVSVAHVELRSASALLAESSQAQERLRIARELHDVLGHQLTALALELEIGAHEADGEARECVLRARAMAKALLTDVRSVVGEERHRAFDLRGALQEVVTGVPRPRVHLDVAPDLTLDDARATTLVRAVQEIVTNAIRHSQAENLHVRVSGTGAVVRLEAWDDGVGARRLTTGNGLRGLRERVELHGGQVELDGSDGFRVRAELPVREVVAA